MFCLKCVLLRVLFFELRTSHWASLSPLRELKGEEGEKGRGKGKGKREGEKGRGKGKGKREGEKGRGRREL